MTTSSPKNNDYEEHWTSLSNELLHSKTILEKARNTILWKWVCASGCNNRFPKEIKQLILNEFVDYYVLHRLHFQRSYLDNQSSVKLFWDENELDLNEKAKDKDTEKEKKYCMDGIFDSNGKLIRFRVNEYAKAQILKDLLIPKCIYVYFSWRLGLLERGNYKIMDRIENSTNYFVTTMMRSGPVTNTFDTYEEALTKFNETPAYYTVVFMGNGKVVNKRFNGTYCWTACAGHILLEIIDNMYAEEMYKGHNTSGYSLTGMLKIA